MHSLDATAEPELSMTLLYIHLRPESSLLQLLPEELMITSMTRASKKVEIRTERLLLRGGKKEDLPAFRKWFEDPKAMKYWSTPVHRNVEQTKDFLDTMIESPNNGKLEFVICLMGASADTNGSTKKSRKASKPIVIGLVGLWEDNELGFIFNREYWGKGYASEAVQALLNKFWTDNGGTGDLVKADVDPRNLSCLKLLEKFGFVEVGRAKNTFETHIGWCDSVYLEAKKSAGS